MYDQVVASKKYIAKMKSLGWKQCNLGLLPPSVVQTLKEIRTELMTEYRKKQKEENGQPN